MNKKWKIVTLLILILLLVLWIAKERFLVDNTKAITAVSTTSVKNIALIEIKNFYNQRDKFWAKDKLGNTNETVGKVGCLVSSVGMNLSYYDIEMNPKVVNEKLTTIEGYTSNGWLIWSKLTDITNEKVSISFPKLSHESIEKHLLNKVPVLAKLYIGRVIPHWVLIVGEKDGEFMMLDPLKDEKPVKFSSYGSAIYAIRIMERG
jgi:hypothetical protein